MATTRKTDEERRRAAKAFVERWTYRRGSEKGEDQQFWNDLLRSVLGVEDVEARIRYQVPVPTRGTTKFLDAWIPETRVLVEHKSRGVDLAAPQSGHGGLTPYEQAAEYDAARPFGEKARWIVTCNFDRFEIHDRARPLAPPLAVRLADLPKEVHRLAFLVDPSARAVDRELEVSVQAGRIVGALYDALLACYGRADAAALAALNRLCVRLVFCLYAEDAGLFPKDCLRRLVEATPADFLRVRLVQLFRALDTPPGRRAPYLEPALAAFPYANGGLFRDAAEGDVPPLSEAVRGLLLGASRFDWRAITPTVFGALFESTLNPETRRAGGMVYTSVENIRRVIGPLFLDGLTRRVDAAVAAGAATPAARRALDALQDELASLTFLDPACGSGNFLTETYLSLRRLENRLIAARQRGQAELDLGAGAKVSLAQFRGIEVNDFAVAVAKTALWIAESQMRRETAEILHREPDYLPLRDFGGVVEGNALALDWPRADYVMGNPPFVGASMMTAAQKAEAVAVIGKGRRTSSVDYVGAWYHKAAALLRGTAGRAAFVSTNSITQGEQVAPLWRPLFEKYGLVIDFAWRTFKWHNEAQGQAAVHCVIVGFHAEGDGAARSIPKALYDGDGTARPAANICPYLIDAPTVFVESRGTPLGDVPRMTYGCKPSDGGNLILSAAERDALLAGDPSLAVCVRRYVGARDFINADEKRWCLWLKDVSPAVYRRSREIMRRLAAVREMRLASSAEPTRKMAEKPFLFFSTPPLDGHYLLLPEVSSERRAYIPIGFMEPGVIAANTTLVVPHATRTHFGVLTSSVHMAWMRAVAGRLEMRYRYSAAVVYNNFPWPEAAGEPVARAAQAILDARARYPEASLADLYDPLTMPADLRAAHAANDRAVLAAYGLAADAPEHAVVAHLFGLYAERTEGRGEG